MVQRYEKIRKPHLNDLRIFLSFFTPFAARRATFSAVSAIFAACFFLYYGQKGSGSRSDGEKKPFKQGGEAVLSRLHRTCKLFAAGVRKSFGGRGKTLQRSPNACCAFANHNTKKSASNPDCRYRVCYRSAKIQKISRKCKFFSRFFSSKNKERSFAAPLLTYLR